MKFFVVFVSLLFTQSKASKLPNVKAHFYDSSYSDCTSFTVDNVGAFSSLPLSKFDPHKKTEIFVHGWNEGPNVEGPQTIINAYLEKKVELDCNVVLIDWSFYAQGDYLGVASKLNLIADTVRNILDSCKSQGLVIENTHLVGFSFGSVLCGRIGRWFKANRGCSFPRITGLDPANFYGTVDFIFWLNGITKLTRNDANFVDIIHTNTGYLGDRKTCGHIDFWPNSGSNQPGCSILSLSKFTSLLSFSIAPYSVAKSHIRAWLYYAESIAHPSAFIAKKCSSNTYSDSNCQGSTAPMGYYATPSVEGFSKTSTLNYYCSTNADSPYSKS